MAEKFEAGDVVLLKSGGPKMTIDSYDQDDEKYRCEWFVEGKVQHQLFRASSLEKYVSAGW